MIEDAPGRAPHELVVEFVRVTAHLPAKEAARRIGVTPGTVRLWRGTLPQFPVGRVRRRLEEYLSRTHEPAGIVP